eukprot:TRINITY_DN4638_c1_g1_i1.p1 TRINITY_DN4638_c1_g1~~TRINITY_DN4638_c1_g1_i1.p1  ORF type:complete len:131 (+),score=38.86 TRINITY_DN4638_c1_g1_i1:23-394(+)
MGRGCGAHSFGQAQVTQIQEQQAYVFPENEEAYGLDDKIQKYVSQCGDVHAFAGAIVCGAVMAVGNMFGGQTTAAGVGDYATGTAADRGIAAVIGNGVAGVAGIANGVTADQQQTQLLPRKTR